jgi:hypothetical protein
MTGNASHGLYLLLRRLALPLNVQTFQQTQAAEPLTPLKSDTGHDQNVTVNQIMQSDQGHKVRRIALLLVSWLVISFPMTSLAGHEEDWIDTIPADRLKRLLDSGVKLFLVDLRPVKEFQQNRSSRVPQGHVSPKAAKRG